MKAVKKILLWLKKVEKIIEIITFVDFVNKNLNLIRLEIIVTLQVKIEDQLIVIVRILMQRNKAVLFQL